jgi:beta-mannanase
MRDLKGHADYLEQLAKARVPVLWRPLHEIEGGWFWWTDSEKPENTAALWRFMFDYFTKERKLHNLIWVYAAALRCGKGQEGVTNVEMRTTWTSRALTFTMRSSRVPAGIARMS